MIPIAIHLLSDKRSLKKIIPVIVTNTMVPMLYTGYTMVAGICESDSSRNLAEK